MYDMDWYRVANLEDAANFERSAARVAAFLATPEATSAE